MAQLAFDIATVTSGAIADRLSLCQTALWGGFFAILILFVRDKRQMLRVGFWGIGMSFLGAAMRSYGALGAIQASTTPAMAEFAVGIVLLAAGFVEMYKHEFLKVQPVKNEIAARFIQWLRRSTLPFLMAVSSIIQPPCSSGPYPLLSQALTLRPGQVIEMYLLTYLIILFAPLAMILLMWYAVLSIPGMERFKSQHRLAIRLLVGAATASIGVYLLWHTHAITLLPGLATIGS